MWKHICIGLLMALAGLGLVRAEFLLKDIDLLDPALTARIVEQGLQTHTSGPCQPGWFDEGDDLLCGFIGDRPMVDVLGRVYSFTGTFRPTDCPDQPEIGALKLIRRDPEGTKSDVFVFRTDVLEGCTLVRRNFLRTLLDNVNGRFWVKVGSEDQLIPEFQREHLILVVEGLPALRVRARSRIR